MSAGFPKINERTAVIDRRYSSTDSHHKLDRFRTACYRDAQHSSNIADTFREEHRSVRDFELEVGMKHISVCVLVGLLFCALTGATVWAQATTAQIGGTVKDQTGAVLPGVEIAVTQTATGAKRTEIGRASCRERG